jgi:hypothetical protein
MAATTPATTPRATHDVTMRSTPGTTVLSIDTRDTGVDLGLTPAPDGTLASKAPGSAAVGASERRPALDNTGGAAGAASSAATRAGSSDGADAGALGDAHDVDAHAKPGTSTLGNPTRAAGRGDTDAHTAAQAAASTSRTVGGNPVAGRILGGSGSGGAASGAGR